MEPKRETKFCVRRPVNQPVEPIVRQRVIRLIVPPTDSPVPEPSFGGLFEKPTAEDFFASLYKGKRREPNRIITKTKPRINLGLTKKGTPRKRPLRPIEPDDQMVIDRYLLFNPIDGRSDLKITHKVLDILIKRLGVKQTIRMVKHLKASLVACLIRCNKLV